MQDTMRSRLNEDGRGGVFGRLGQVEMLNLGAHCEPCA